MKARAEYGQLKTSMARVFLLLLTLFSVTSCKNESQEKTGIRDVSASLPSFNADLRQADANVLIVILDAARADSFGSWGYTRDTTPHIDALGEASSVFLNTFSQAPTTQPSALSYFSGRYFPAGVSDAENVGFAEGEHTMAKAFAQSGFRTGGFSENPYITAQFGFDAGFQHFEEFTDFWSMELEQQNHVGHDRSEIVDHAIEWILQADDSPWFAYVHLLRPHGPYVAPEPLGKKFVGAYTGPLDGSVASIESVRYTARPEEAQHLKDLYDGTLAYADQMVQGMLDTLREQGLFDKTWIIIAADHGEAFMEHGRMLHGGHLYDEAIHVPLVIKPASSSKFAPRRVEALVEMIDLYPTFVEAFGLAPPSQLDGQSLLGLMSGSVTTHKPHAYSFARVPQAVAIRSATEKVLFRYGERFGAERIGKVELFNLLDDPGEQSGILPTNARFKPWRKLATHHLALKNSTVSLRQVETSEELREQLESIGYNQ